ncbi:hypothetical protein C8029_12890 [Roseobacter sp. TSBP12]|nr:hypothetical protein C8029_12890 [Roseobacter sp. TSBP12]
MLCGGHTRIGVEALSGLTLKFEFDNEDKPFTLSSSEMVVVYQSVMDKIAIPDTIRICMLPMWLEAARAGDPRRTKAALSPLAGLSAWKWPEFDRWRKRFKAENSYPSQWLRIEKEAQKWPNPLHAKRMLLLDLTLSFSINSRRDFLQWQEPHRLNKDWEFRLDICDVEQRIAEEHASSLKLTDWTTWPPFYPGNSSAISLKLPLTKCRTQG